MVATSITELRANARAVRARLTTPANAVVDRGINLRALRQPPAPPPAPPVPRIIWIPHKVRIADVLQLVGDYYRIPVDTLTTKRRTVTLLRLRRVCGWLAHEVLGRSYPEIADAMNRRTHKGQIAGVCRVYQDMKLSSDLAYDVAELELRMAALGRLLIAGRPRPEPKLSMAMTRSMAIARVMKLTADFYKMPVECVLGRSRLVAVVRVRHIACHLARDLLRRSFSEIGRTIDRDHSTVVVAVQKIKAWLPTDAALAYDVELLKEQILNDKGGV